ncbi:MAG: hypothetical protein KJ070_18300 [Verrucomicrobia bacterium]|nr:hypothetical protein [Verrucomicrobiota bacterium]
MRQHFRIGVVPRRAGEARGRLLGALRRLYPVEFEASDAVPAAGVDGLLLFDHPLAEAAAATRNGTPVCLFTTKPSAVTAEPRALISCADAPALDRTLRGQRLEDESLRDFTPLIEAGDEVLASKDGQPFWRRNVTGGGVLYRVAGSPPELEPTEGLWHHFHAGNCARLLPLLHFLRECLGDRLGPPAPLRAVFIFDDPDLSRFHYGCLDFARLAEHAAEHNYHAAIALVPLTAARVNGRLAALFRAEARRLSLLMHGNNHTYCELLETPSEARAVTVLAEALRRIESMEQRFGLEVARVMEAPHAAMACHVFPALASLGYEAASATTDRIILHNPQAVWPPEFGMDLADVMPGGLGLIPRIRMSAQWRTEVVLAAFLRKPVVLAGHHNDARNGLELLAEFARLVNGFGSVEWSSLTAIARGSYRLMPCESGVRVRAYQRRLAVRLPAGLAHVTIERPWLDNGDVELLSLESDGGGTVFHAPAGRVSPPVPVSAARSLRLHSPVPNARDFHTVPGAGLPLWPLARRLLTEARDRAYPWLKRNSAPDKSPPPTAHV